MVRASWQVPAPQKQKFTWGRRVLRHRGSQTLSSEKRMGDLGDKLLGWDAQNLGSAPRERKNYYRCHEFSALNALSKICLLCFGDERGDSLHTVGCRISCLSLWIFDAGSKEVRSRVILSRMAISQLGMTSGPWWRDRAWMEPSWGCSKLVFRSLSLATCAEGSVLAATIRNQVKGFPSSAECLPRHPKMSHPTSHPALVGGAGKWCVKCWVSINVTAKGCQSQSDNRRRH